ncbi:uncharacterized protein B0T23DRAFT_128483 [Neurospora hispaniola]|uniref:Secreted protein n=1 Tax=Neurospora hispaniola TaxID=588809 RepID=A0AAJ0IB39_9PEZI|nr:hypothetical protein B0T23DRAFT_128483 [Neurospora hispaniola]
MIGAVHLAIAVSCGFMRWTLTSATKQTRSTMSSFSKRGFHSDSGATSRPKDHSLGHRLTVTVGPSCSDTLQLGFSLLWLRPVQTPRPTEQGNHMSFFFCQQHPITWPAIREESDRAHEAA